MKEPTINKPEDLNDPLLDDISDPILDDIPVSIPDESIATICPICNGAGYTDGSTIDCEACEGAGEILCGESLEDEDSYFPTNDDYDYD